MTARLSVVVPTFNEANNVQPLVDRLEEVLEGVSWEVVFVDDDSPDGTHAKVLEIAQRNPRVRAIRRIDRRGLSSACIEGMLATSSPFIAVMDADGQHDETILPAMLEALEGDGVDIVIGSRYVEEGGVGDWNRTRHMISRLTTRLGLLVLREPVHDPLSGFFMLRRTFLDRVVARLSGIGFKILLDLLASSREPIQFREAPYEFGSRMEGESKLSAVVAWEYIVLLLDKMFGRFLPVRFLGFVFNGAIGALFHLAILGILYLGAGVAFLPAQTLAALIAGLNNYLLNNFLTYKERRRSGWGLLLGLVGFYLACGVGMVANILVATFLFEHSVPWYLAGILGGVIGSVWNFAVTSTLIWKTR